MAQLLTDPRILLTATLIVFMLSGAIILAVLLVFELGTTVKIGRILIIQPPATLKNKHPLVRATIGVLGISFVFLGFTHLPWDFLHSPDCNTPISTASSGTTTPSARVPISIGGATFFVESLSRPLSTTAIQGLLANFPKTATEICLGPNGQRGQLPTQEQLAEILRNPDISPEPGTNELIQLTQGQEARIVSSNTAPIGGISPFLGSSTTKFRCVWQSQ